MKAKRVLLIIMIVVILAVGAVFAYCQIISNRSDIEQVPPEATESVPEIVQPPVIDISEPPVEEPTDNYEQHENDYEIEYVDLTPFLELIAALADAREQIDNDDIVGFISIPNTNVNYPFVQTVDNSFYLYHDVHRNSSSAGAVFLDYLSTPDFTDPNTIIYGHNMRSGIIFHNLRYYVFGAQSQEFLEDHPNIYIVTDDYVLVFEIFSVFTTHIDFYYIQVYFAEGEFEELVNELNHRSYHDTGITATGEDNLLLLSTCTNIHRDTRIVIASRLAQRLEIH